ncbi:MAG: hypothetical protein Ta2G_16430 [Termitinemataceae bacterium]|nr:MAG: hypothetical protein Ta2G_16430 [Termitinemataceae bacterium]
MEFSTLDLHADLKKGLQEAGYQSAMPVQEQVIANAFTGRDIYVQSQTGSGKTAAYLIVVFQRLLSDPLLKGKKALIMVPTRELAVQVETEAKLIGKYLKFKMASFYGGVGYGSQQQALRNGAQILTGTPGRVLDLNASGHMNLMETGFLVLDEADRMFDMGFYPALRQLIKVLPTADKRQTMLFSATLNNYVKNLAWEYTKEPVSIEIEAQNITVDEIDQVLYHVASQDKMKLLLGIFAKEQPESAIIFCNTKRYTEVVAKRLRANGIKAEFISGDLRQNQRMAIIDNFKAGKLRFLVATDVAARGIDVEGLAMVVNYDLPNETENYVHRIGRTARAGLSGKAISFACEQDVYQLADIEKYIEKKINAIVADNFMLAEDKALTELPKWKSGRKERQPKVKRGGTAPLSAKPSGFSDTPRTNSQGGRRYDGSGGSRQGGTQNGSNRSPDSRGGSRQGGSRKGSKRNNNSRNSSNRGGNNREQSRNGSNNENLTALPFEKRMEVYKEKYGGNKSAGKNSGKNSGSHEHDKHIGQSHSHKTEKTEKPKKSIFTNVIKIFKKK